MRTQEQMIAEIQRVAKLLGANRVSQDDFEKHGEMSLSGVTYHFGSWNRAIEAAGLEVYDRQAAMSVPILSDSELLEEIIRLTRELGKRPTEREMGAFGRFSPKPYSDRWGTFAKARDVAYVELGMPEIEK
jgi:hypothetical protein